MTTTVKELIEILKDCPQDYTVWTTDWQIDDKWEDRERELNPKSIGLNKTKKNVNF